jgi:hypothetical protein
VDVAEVSLIAVSALVMSLLFALLLGLWLAAAKRGADDLANAARRSTGGANRCWRCHQGTSLTAS